MRRFVLLLIGVLFLPGLVVTARAGSSTWGMERRQLKAQQKQERRNLKMQQRNRKQSWRGYRLSPAERSRAKHEMQRERRNLKQAQKDALQSLKDNQRAVGEIRHAYGR